MKKVGRPVAKDPVISKPVSLPTSFWDAIAERNQTRAEFFRHLIEDWDDLRDMDSRKMSTKRLFLICMNRFQFNNDQIYAKMYKLMEQIDEDGEWN